MVNYFTVTPLDTGVGSFPVTYRFIIQPAGEFWTKSTILITLPDEVRVSDERNLEKRCGANMSGFTYTKLNCRLNNGNKLYIEQGFKFEGTDVMKTSGLVPPTI